MSDKITQKQLNDKMREHHKWLTTKGREGTRAMLNGMDLRGMDLSYTDLCDANLREADLSGASLWGAKIKDARWRGAILPDGKRWHVDMVNSDYERFTDPDHPNFWRKE